MPREKRRQKEEEPFSLDSPDGSCSRRDASGCVGLDTYLHSKQTEPAQLFEHYLGESPPPSLVFLSSEHRDGNDSFAFTLEFRADAVTLQRLTENSIWSTTGMHYSLGAFHRQPCSGASRVLRSDQLPPTFGRGRGELCIWDGTDRAILRYLSLE